MLRQFSIEFTRTITILEQSQDKVKSMIYVLNREAFINTYSRDIGFDPLVCRWIYREFETSTIDHFWRYKSYKKSIYSHRNPYGALEKFKMKCKIKAIFRTKNVFKVKYDDLVNEPE